MKLEKKHYIVIAVIVLIIIIWYFSKKKKDESSYRRARNIGSSGQERGTSNYEDSAWWIFSKKPIQVTTPDSTASGCTSCWVSSTENGVDYCRWFDNYGRNTRTFTGSCNTSQSNMGQRSTQKKPWWAVLFGI